MIVQAIVKRKRKTRIGRGFTREELQEVGLSYNQASKLRIPIDVRRSSKHEENVQTLKAFLSEALDHQVTQRKEAVLDLSEVKGIGSKLSGKLKQAGIKNANELATSNPKKITRALGSSETRAKKLIESARSLLKEAR